MESNYGQTEVEKEIDNIIVKIIFPITDELMEKTKEIKRKRQELKKEMYNFKQLKQSLIEKRKKLNKQKLIYENLMNGDFSNVKTCSECLINYINLVDKKETEFLKDKEDYYDLKLRRKELEFNNMLVDLIKEKNNIEKKKKIKRKMSYEPPKKLNQSTNSISKNMNKSFRSDTSETKTKTNKDKTVPQSRGSKTQKYKKDSYKPKKSGESSKILKRKNSNDSNMNDTKDIPDISKEIENLINDYASKKSKATDNNSFDNLNEGLNQLKEINKDTKNIENDLKEMMNNFLNDEQLTESL